MGYFMILERGESRKVQSSIFRENSESRQRCKYYKCHDPKRKRKCPQLPYTEANNQETHHGFLKQSNADFIYRLYIYIYIYILFFKKKLFKSFLSSYVIQFGLRISSIEVSKQKLFIAMSTTKHKHRNPSRSSSFLEREESQRDPRLA